MEIFHCRWGSTRSITYDLQKKFVEEVEIMEDDKRLKRKKRRVGDNL